MKRFALFFFAALFCGSALCNECWSEGFRFDGSEIMGDALLQPYDPIAISTFIAPGEPRYIQVKVQAQFDFHIATNLFYDDSASPWEGIINWDYTAEEYKDFPTDETYLLKHIVGTDIGLTTIKRTITILPEPALLIGLAALGVLFLRKRIKATAAVLCLAMLCSFGAKAEEAVSSVSCLQMWPFLREVIITYWLSSESDDPSFQVGFYGTIDDGETTFELSSRGKLERDGADGVVAGKGRRKTIWTPDDSFFPVFTENFKIKVVAEEIPPPETNVYMVIDLSGGKNAESYPVSYLDDVPEGGWTQEHKTTKLVLRKVKPGTFSMGSPESELGRSSNETKHETTLSEPYYIGVFEVTQKQYVQVMGSNPSHYQGDDRPVDSVSYGSVRGTENGLLWPDSQRVDANTFLGKLRAKTNVDFDLPTEAQWEFACRAGTTTALNNGTDLSEAEKEDENMDKVGRYYNDCYDGKGGYNEHAVVGSYLPNDWGLYDMHGNVWEWCLDWYQEDLGGDPALDPKGPAEGTERVRRGGAYNNYAKSCRSACRDSLDPSQDNYRQGFRIAARKSHEYMVVDLSGGKEAESFPVSYLDRIPDGGWNDEHKTTKLVLKRVSPGSFLMGSPEGELGRSQNETQHKVTLTEAFYIAIFETTQKQYQLIAGGNPSTVKRDTHPLETVSYDMLRGTGSGWPADSKVTGNSLFGKLRAKTNLLFDLPTDAQWEYACRAGTTTALNSGADLSDEKDDDNLNKLGRYYYDYDDGKGGVTNYTHTVAGSYWPNAWGIYDMHGNVWEWCLDWYKEDLGEDPATNPKGPSNGEKRCMRSGGVPSEANRCRSASRSDNYPNVDNQYCGFRCVLIP